MDTLTSRAEPQRFTFGMSDIQLEDSGAGGGQFTVAGHAAVFNKPSHDMGGFRFQIAPSAFNKALAADPDVHLVLNHDMRWVLGRTRNKTLEFRVDPAGLHIWSRVAPTSYAADTRILLERGDVDQMSFAGFIGEDEWYIDAEGNATCTILEFSELIDATICAQGAFPQTDVRVAASRYFSRAVDLGRVPGRAADGPPAASAGEPTDAAPARVDVEPLNCARGLEMARARTRKALS